MTTACVFPGQGAQFVGMGQALYNNDSQAKALFETANELLGFRLTDIMFGGTPKELQQTKVTQPAIFLHSVILAKTAPKFQPNMVAGHSLGELSALVACQVLTFEAGLQLVAQRAQAMQVACEQDPGSMAAILGLNDDIVAQVCESVDALVAPANYNCPGQLVISGTEQGVALACEALKAAGAKRALVLPVGGAFHSSLMAPAKEELAQAIAQTSFQEGICPIYQNVNAAPSVDPEVIQENLVQQLTSPVRWTQTVQRMIQDGAQRFVECGPGKVLQGLVKKIDTTVEATAVNTLSAE